ncbi:unnamed protein product [Chironomus riparius]|uniref:Uncharacterized protein n=1 Tax=Chironomus riparius TaxID=315576 RepID=A0A9N9WS53_9DIPT|nr:unnamed protein product [Chironomus riparius]
MMDEKDSKKAYIQQRGTNNNNSMPVERNLLASVCWPFRRIFDIFINLFHNSCTDSTDGRMSRRFRRWTNRIRNAFRRNSNRQNIYHINEYPRLVLPKINVEYEYNMNHENRGIAVIYNQEYFANNTGFQKRDGTDVDLDSLIKSLERLDFKVLYFSDLNKDELIKSLRKVSSMDYSKSDCILIAILSHGQLNRIFSRDDSYHISLITSFFTDENCPSLRGKPKVFLIQACRGGQFDYGYDMQNSSNYRLRRVNMGSYEDVDVTATGLMHSALYETEMVHNPPNHPDFLIVRSTMPNYVSFRNKQNGSWFIQDLCTELNKYANELDLLTLLTFVNGQVALRESVPDKGKQTICISSMLTKRLIFHAKNRLEQS